MLGGIAFHTITTGMYLAVFSYITWGFCGIFQRRDGKWWIMWWPMLSAGGTRTEQSTWHTCDGWTTSLKVFGRYTNQINLVCDSRSNHTSVDNIFQSSGKEIGQKKNQRNGIDQNVQKSKLPLQSAGRWGTEKTGVPDAQTLAILQLISLGWWYPSKEMYQKHFSWLLSWGSFVFFCCNFMTFYAQSAATANRLRANCLR